MKMSKYIIKNCPSYDKDYEECLNTFRDEYKKCYDCSSCVMKQIVELCKYGISYYSNLRMLSTMAEQILQLLDIQEVE